MFGVLCKWPVFWIRMIYRNAANNIFQKLVELKFYLQSWFLLLNYISELSLVQWMGRFCWESECKTKLCCIICIALFVLHGQKQRMKHLSWFTWHKKRLVHFLSRINFRLRRARKNDLGRRRILQKDNAHFLKMNMFFFGIYKGLKYPYILSQSYW